MFKNLLAFILTKLVGGAKAKADINKADPLITASKAAAQPAVDAIVASTLPDVTDAINGVIDKMGADSVIAETAKAAISGIVGGVQIKL